MTRNYLLDLNVLIALMDSSHRHYAKAQEWFVTSGKERWGLCPLTEAGFLRITTNSAYRSEQRTFLQAIAIIQILKGRPGCVYWEIGKSWVELTAPFAHRISGHQQITDAYLLGMAIAREGVLVTFDKGVLYMAGKEFRSNVELLGA